MATTTKIKRGVRNGIIKSIKEAYAIVTNHANVGSKLDSVLSMDPRNVVRDVLHRRYTGERMGLAVWLEHKAKADVIPEAVSTLRECLACVPVSEAVHPVLSKCPSVTNHETPRMVPHLWGDRAGKPLRKYLFVFYDVQPDEKILFAVYRIVEPGDIGVKLYGSGRIETVSACVYVIPR